MAALCFLQFGLLLLLILQLHGIMITYKFLEVKRNMLLNSYFSVRKSFVTKKKTFSSSSAQSERQNLFGLLTAELTSGGIIY